MCPILSYQNIETLTPVYTIQSVVNLFSKLFVQSLRTFNSCTVVDRPFTNPCNEMIDTPMLLVVILT